MRSLKILTLVFRVLVLGFLAGFLTEAYAQNPLSPLAGEYGIIGTLPGDQVHSSVSFNSNGGWIVWQDNATDGDGMGISARRLNSSLSGDFNVFRVNQNGAGDQENPCVSMLQDGGAVFVWQGGNPGFQKIYARFMASNMTFRTGDILVNTYPVQSQIQPTAVVLSNGNVVITWASYGQDGSHYGIYGRIFSSTGTMVTDEFSINQSTNFNQRSASVSPLAGGNFIVAWVSERPRSINDTNNFALSMSVDIYGRIFGSAGGPVGNEFLLSSGTNICAHPAVAGTPDGGFIAGWSQRDTRNSTNSWDIFSRLFSSSGSPQTSPARINTRLIGDQVAPKIGVTGTNAFIIWTSMGQDGFQEGVYGQDMTLTGVPAGHEMRVNTTTVSKQIHPVLGLDADGRYLAIWSSFVGGSSSFDLYAQRFVVGNTNILVSPSAPFVFANDPNSLHVTWPEMAGYAVAFYELYIDGNPVPVVNTIHTTITNLLPSSTHAFQLLYQLDDGRRSPLSPSGSGTTWGSDDNGDGLSDDWQAAQWGANPAHWPAPNVDSDGDGANNGMEFLAGTDPKDAGSVLTTRLTMTGLGFVFSWNTESAQVYQVQAANHLGGWQNFGLPRFAHGIVDAVAVTPGGQTAFYRVIRLR